MKARDAVVGFMKSWQSKDFDKMKNFCTKAWHRDGAQDQLKVIFGNRKLKNYQVKKTNNKGFGLADVPIIVEFENGEKRIAIASLMCEGSIAYRPNVNGEWGVNVASLLTTHGELNAGN